MVGIGMDGAIASSTAAPHFGVVFRPVVGQHASVAIEGLWRKHDGNPLRHRLLRHIRARRVETLGGAALTLADPATAPRPDRG